MGKFALAAILVASIPPLRAEKLWAVDSRSLLISFDSQSPGFITNVLLIRGLQPGEGVLAIDFRPANKRLYALGSSSRIYVLNTDTGDAAPVGSSPFSSALDGAEFGFDFNPTVDRIRITSNKGQNLRLHPDTGAVVSVDGALKYADGSAPRITGSAYTNSVAGATSTVLYNIDAGAGTLVTQNPPNDGVLNPGGPLVNMDLSDLAGFDISPVTGRAYLAQRESRSQKVILHEVHLATGDYQPLGQVNFFEQISGLAVDPFGTASGPIVR